MTTMRTRDTYAGAGGGRRALAWIFWIGLIGFIALDLAVSAPRDRFDEPPMLALGSGKAAGAGHCSGATR